LGVDCIQNLFYFAAAVGIRVPGKNSPPRGAADFPGSLRGEIPQEFGYFTAVTRYQNFFSGLEKAFDPLPSVADDACPGAGGFEDARGGAEPISGHALAIDVENGSRRAIERVVIGRINMPHPTRVRWHWTRVPPVASNHEAQMGKSGGWLKKELVYTRFAIR
jgi:hypothetical protein